MHCALPTNRNESSRQEVQVKGSVQSRQGGEQARHTPEATYICDGHSSKHYPPNCGLFYRQSRQEVSSIQVKQSERQEAQMKFWEEVEIRLGME